MARVNIDSEALTDSRFHVLAAELNLASNFEALGRMVPVWMECVTRRVYALSPRSIDFHLGKGGAAALLVAELGEELEDGTIRIRGTAGRTDYLERQNPRAGGVARAASARRADDGTFATSQSVQQPSSTLDQQPSSVPSPATSSPLPLSPAPALSPAPENQKREEPPKPPRGFSRRSAKSTLGKLERDAAMAVLLKLREQTGIPYQGGVKHTRLILGRYADGYDELDLRKVIAYAARTKQEGGLGWNSDEKMRMFLRPETLFGPETIERYVDAARSWWANKGTGDPSPSPEFVAWRQSQMPRLRVVGGED